MSYKCSKSGCEESTLYRNWVCKTHQAEMKCENNNRDDCMCNFCYMTNIIQSDIEYQKYGYIPGTCLRQRWKCITCCCKGQLSKYTSEKGIHYDKTFIITYRGFCLDCLEKQKRNRALLKQIIEFNQ